MFWFNPSACPICSYNNRTDGSLYGKSREVNIVLTLCLFFVAIRVSAHLMSNLVHTLLIICLPEALFYFWVLETEIDFLKRLLPHFCSGYASNINAWTESSGINIGTNLTFPFPL